MSRAYIDRMLRFSVALAIVASTSMAVSARHARAEPGDTYQPEIQRRGPYALDKAAGPLLPRLRTSGRPSQCPVHAWCGCYLADRYGLTDKSLWNARRWATIGRPAFAGCIGCIAVLTRGRGGHVGIVIGYVRGNNPVVLSGNHNNAVGVGTYPAARVLAYREL